MNRCRRRSQGEKGRQKCEIVRRDAHEQQENVGGRKRLLLVLPPTSLVFFCPFRATQFLFRLSFLVGVRGTAESLGC